MEKLWNLSKTAVPMEKTMEFSFWWKKVRAFFLKKSGKNMSGLQYMVSTFVASVITSLGLALRTSRAIALASAE